MNLGALFQNEVLITMLTAWFLAQMIKMPFDYLFTRRWNWGLLLSVGGMPSSHTSLLTSATLATGLFYGFETPLFALGVAITMVVTYDAAGSRRQVGMHAQRINFVFQELLRGHTVDQKELREVLGHTPLEVTGGVLFGMFVATLMWSFWPF
ncbi:MAG: divergent PAP2 family protein [Anaerolineae bacterium]|nr:divergent PAP2 family protein [Anaerolineae bacterium]MDK1080659.1 divergent PAP2 family protein [Anaerolineae bacterium]MDK1118445.1 divergent PAP2 family protein [Anaerolineae bacterium]